MRVTFKWGPHFVALEDGSDVVCQDEQLRAYLTQLMDMEAVQGGPDQSPVFKVMESLEGYVTDVQWIETETIY